MRLYENQGFVRACYNAEELCATVAELSALRGQAREVAILTFFYVYADEEGYDNWNGGTYSLAINLRVLAAVYVQFSKEAIDQCQQSLKDTLREVVINENHQMRFLIGVAISKEDDWRLYFPGGCIRHAARLSSLSAVA